MLFPQTRREEMDLEGRMGVNPLQYIHEVDVGIDALQATRGEQTLNDTDIARAHLHRPRLALYRRSDEFHKRLGLRRTRRVALIPFLETPHGNRFPLTEFLLPEPAKRNTEVLRTLYLDKNSSLLLFAQRTPKRWTLAQGTSH